MLLLLTLQSVLVSYSRELKKYANTEDSYTPPTQHSEEKMLLETEHEIQRARQLAWLTPF